jgi:hypothetical protein
MSINTHYITEGTEKYCQGQPKLKLQRTELPLFSQFTVSRKKLLPFWATELGDQNPSADFLPNISYTERIINICNECVILQKEFPLPHAEIIL